MLVLIVGGHRTRLEHQSYLLVIESYGDPKRMMEDLMIVKAITSASSERFVHGSDIRDISKREDVSNPGHQGPTEPSVRSGNPFFTPPVTSGRIAVKLHPMENVTPGTPTLVTFGVPFTRGSLPIPALETVRILRSGVEVPAYVEALTPWRHMTDPSVDGQSVRIARIQIEHAFSTMYPDHETIEVEWGQTARTQNITEFTDPRTAWHLVDSGSFVADDGVYEPDVYVTLPKDHLVQGALIPARILPFDDTVTEARSDPELMDATSHWPGFVEQEYAHKNDFYTVINEDDPRVAEDNLCHYKTDFEPWLYDRAATMFLLYVRSGFVKPLREAVRHVQFYKNNLWPEGTTPPRAVGLFKLKNPNPANWPGGNGAMYSCNESLAYVSWLAADDEALPHIHNVSAAHETHDEDTRWSPTLVVWTERHTAFRLLANVVAYEVFGDDTYRDRIMTQTADFIWHQDGAGGQLPEDRVDGGLYHDAFQHGEGDPGLVASPWMTMLTVDAMVRAYAVNDTPEIAHFLRRVGTFLKAAVKVDANHQYDTDPVPLAYPDYIMASDGKSNMRGPDGVEHALDVAAGVAWATFFGEVLGSPDPSLMQLCLDLYVTYDIGVNYWIRPKGPDTGRAAFRVTPWKKWGWQYRTSGALSSIAVEIGIDPSPS